MYHVNELIEIVEGVSLRFADVYTIYTAISQIKKLDGGNSRLVGVEFPEAVVRANKLEEIQNPLVR